VVNFTPRLLTFALFYIIKERENDKGKFNELEMNCKTTDVRNFYTGLKQLKKGYQTRTKLVKDQNDVFVDFRNILNKLSVSY